MLKAAAISYQVGPTVLLHETTVTFAPGRFHVIMGANGAGKSTLLKVLAGEQQPAAGAVYLEGKPLHHYSKTALAVKRAVLSQHLQLSFPITVEEIVLMGRYPYFATHPTARDKAICNEAMALMHVEHLAERDYTTLSGGEAQKVQMCRVLAQMGDRQAGEKKVLFLDEPVSHLDVKYQYQLLRAAKALCQEQATVIAILHDINLALAFADRLLFMKEGRLVHDLEQVSALTPAILQEVFGMPAALLYPDGRKPVVLFEEGT